MVESANQAESERMSEAFARSELSRVEKIREEQGDETWARVLGESVVDQLTLIHYQNDPENFQLAQTGRRTLIALTPQLELLHSHPQYGCGAAAGLIEGLAARGYIPLDVDSLIRQRWEREATV